MCGRVTPTPRYPDGVGPGMRDGVCSRLPPQVPPLLVALAQIRAFLGNPPKGPGSGTGCRARSGARQVGAGGAGG